MVDMSRHLRRWLNDATLRRDFSGRYEGVIASVHEELIRNRFTAVKQVEPVITFDDGWRLIPNIGMRRALIEFYGANTDDWIGRRIVVFRSETRDTKAGTTRWEKRVMRADVEFRRAARGAAR